MSSALDDLEVRRFRVDDLPEDLQVFDRAITGLTLVRNSMVGAVGGLHLFNGRHWVFFNIFDETLRRPFILHRLCKHGLRAAQDAGISPIYAMCDGGVHRAPEWLVALGFRPLRDDEKDDEIRMLERIRGIEDKAYIK